MELPRALARRQHRPAAAARQFGLERAAEAGEVAALLEQLGFGAIWMSGGQKPGLSGRFRALLEATSRIPVASGILSVWLASLKEIARDIAELEAASATTPAPTTSASRC